MVYKRRRMQHCQFDNKKCLNFGNKLDAEIFIWMQSGFDGFDFAATLHVTCTCHLAPFFKESAP